MEGPLYKTCIKSGWENSSLSLLCVGSLTARTQIFPIFSIAFEFLNPYILYELDGVTSDLSPWLRYCRLPSHLTR